MLQFAIPEIFENVNREDEDGRDNLQVDASLPPLRSQKRFLHDKQRMESLFEDESDELPFPNSDYEACLKVSSPFPFIPNFPI